MHLQVTPLQQCEASSLHVDCFNCDVAFLATGTCMPGQYYYQYSLTNAEGHLAVPVNVTVQIYEQVDSFSVHGSCTAPVAACAVSSAMNS